MIILVTGASGGIGKAIVSRFLREGHEVHGMDTVAFDSEGAGSMEGYSHHISDVCDADTFPELQPEIVINCAGVQDSGRDIDVNLKGAIKVSERYAMGNPKILSVVNIGSASAHTGSEFPEYAASKGGLATYTKNLALRLAPKATCNSIDPGGVITDLNKHVMEDPGLWKQIMDQTPLKRWAEPEEIADWVYFVAVNNRFMTGQNLLIDGGEAGNNRFIW